MTRHLQALLRSACLPVLLHLVCAAILASGLLSLPARAASITNTAAASFTDGPAGPGTVSSNTTTLNALPPPSPGVVTFYQYAPLASGTTPIPFDGASYDSGNTGTLVPLATPLALDGAAISLASPVPVLPTHVYHVNEPVFITLTDADRNTDSTVVEYIDVTVTTSLGDTEILHLKETGPATGVFAGVIQSVGPAVALSPYDGKLSVDTNVSLTVNYRDPYYPSDVSSTAALVDPFGTVFDSVSGAPLNGAVVTIVDAATGLPVLVFGDDGVSSFPASITTGSTVTDSSGKIYNLPLGGFRFPFVPPGNYRFLVTPPSGYSTPSTVPVGSMPNNPAGKPYAVVTGSFSDVFIVVPGPALNIDIPADPSNGGLVLQKTVSQTQASAGDFLQYRLTLTNSSPVAATATTFTDQLPAGMRYRAGSLHADGLQLPDPAQSTDGSTLTFNVGTLAAGKTTQISYVVILGAGVVPGTAVNTATASANAGVLVSNRAQVAVQVKEPLFSGRATLIGRVFDGDCNTPWEQLKGVPNVRVMMEDGTYAITDKDGQYHFEAVRPGTHVVQMDVDSLPPGVDPVSCIENTRFAGRNFSQFVDVKGAALWRADFHTRARSAEIGIRMQSRLDVKSVEIPAVVTSAPAVAAAVPEAPRPNRTYTLHAEFDSCQALLKPEGAADVAKLVKDLAGQDIKRIELIGHTDNQRLSVRCQKNYKDNYALSQARARAVGDALVTGLGLKPEQIVAAGRGPDVPVANNKTPDGMAHNRRTEVRVFLNEEVQAPAAAAPALAPAAAPVVVTPARTISTVTGLVQHIDVDGSTAASKLKVMAMLPDGMAYVAGSTRVDGAVAADPDVAQGVVTFLLPEAAQAGWKHAIEFTVRPAAPVDTVSAETPVSTTQRESVPKMYTVRAQFDSCSTDFHAGGQAVVDKLVAELRTHNVQSIELVGHTDNQRLSPNCQKRFRDNHELSQARAQAVGDALVKGLGLRPDQIVATGKGEDAPLNDNSSAGGRAANRRTEVIVHETEIRESTTVINNAAPVLPQNAALVPCAEAYPVKAIASVEAAQKRVQTPAVETKVGCASAAGAATPGVATPGVATPENQQTDASPRQSVSVLASGAKKLSADLLARQRERESVQDDAAASGADRDWITGQPAGIAWLFPGDDYNPRAPAVRMVIKHAPGQTVVLKQSDGEEVSGLNFDGSQTSADKSVAVSIWRGVVLADGANTFTAEIRDADGKVVQRLSHVVNYSNSPASAELVPEQSILVADGMTRPVLAVRLLDRDGHPVRAGVTGPVEINAPYMAWQQVDQEQKRQLAGLDRFQPQYRVEGDKGIAYIELEPTTESGAVQLGLSFQSGATVTRKQELRAWLAPAARDWVVVGFAEGTLGYRTLHDNAQALEQQGVDGGVYKNGQVSLYAKGRVLGKWLLTMAYDSDKSDQNDRAQSVLGGIDPKQYYTLYGDGTQQRNDAPSQDNLYLKLERGQFYALFGDYTTGLTQTKLSRYSRTLNGIKSENAEGPVVFTVYAADTPQSYARDEIQGDGTSGLYHLTQGNIILNSERIRIETRDRLSNEKILQSRSLTQHLDYDIDYNAGTIFFKQPVNSHDTAFNPVFIVAEYETYGTSNKELNAGGRVGLNLMDGKAQLGLTEIHDENSLNRTNLTGADLKLKVAKDAEVRVEVAGSQSQLATQSTDGTAWLAEFEQHSGSFDSLLYARRQEAGFGVKQQSVADNGQQKVGAEGLYHINNNWSVQGQAYQQDNLSTDTTRDALLGKAQYTTPAGGVSVGAQVVNDSTSSGALAGQDFRSEQATVAGNRWFLDHKLELTAQADTSLGGQNGSVDFPNRYLFGAGYDVTDHARLLVGQEFTDGAALDTSTTRAGFQVVPWKGARLDSTLNQSQISEYGPRTFGQFGLTQAVLLNEKWGLDFSVDSSHTFNRSAQPPLVLNSAYPVANGGGTVTSAALTEDFQAYTAGATYRDDLWTWNGRAETRNGQTTDRYGVVSNFLRQARAGVAFATSAQVFQSQQNVGSDGLLATLDLSWAWRPLGVQWSILDRLEFRYEDVSNGSSVAGSGLFGNTSLTATNASTRRIINNFALNRVSREWTEADRTGNLFRRYERNQWSLYYGAKYAMDTFDGKDYAGYTDLVAVEVRHDIKTWLDVGVQASSLNAWTAGNHAYSFGPMVGISPVTNGWITLGWNVRGFSDRDFDAARYSAEGPYLQLRFKFDQNTRLDFGGRSAAGTDGGNTTTRASE